MTGRIGARKCSTVFAICLSPNICITPVGKKKKPLPYMIYADLSKSIDVIPHVKFNSKPVFVMSQDSIVPRVQGNEPGIGDGEGSCGIDERGNGDIQTGIHLGSVRPAEAAPNVTAESRSVVRQYDLCWMNLKE